MKAKLFLKMATTALILGGCSNDENEGIDNWNGEIRLCSGVNVLQTRANSADVPDKQIAENQLIGIYVSKVTGETATYDGYANVAVKADGIGGFSTYSTMMYYPQSGNGVNIAAYHPYKAEAGDEYDFIVGKDQSDVTNYYASDLLYSANKEFACSKDAHSLTFTHQLSKISCTLTAGDGVSSVADATVEVCSAETAAKFNRTTGTVSAAATSSKQDVKLGVYGAVIAPQEVAADAKLLKVTLSSAAGGGEFYYKVPVGGITFAGGSHYSYAITVKASGLTVTSTITDWTPISKNGDAVMD